MKSKPPLKKTNYSQRMMLLATLPVVLISVFSLTVLHFKLQGFSQQSTHISATQLQQVYESLLTHSTRSVSEKINLHIKTIEDELVILARYAQNLIDTQPPHTAPLPQLTYDPELQVSGSARDAQNIVIQVWNEQHLASGAIDPAALAFIRQMQPAFPLLSTVGSEGTNKSWSYFLGPKSAPVTLVYPWSELAQAFHQLYPEFKQQNWWDYFYPGVMESWGTGIKTGEFDPSSPRDNITWTPLYEDAAGAGTTLTFWAPLWTPNRTEVAGVAGFDFNLQAIIDLLISEQVGQSGYVFLMKENGDVLGLNADQLQALGLISAASDTQSVRTLTHNLNASELASLAEIARSLEHNSTSGIFRFTDQEGQAFMLRVQPLRHHHLWSPETQNIRQQALYILGIIPEAEVLAIQDQLDGYFWELKNSTLGFLIISSTLFALLTLLVAGGLAWRNTLQIRHITRALEEASHPQQAVNVEVVSHDELGRLAESFNSMFEQTRQAHQALEDYAHALEEKVKERTLHLEQANQQLHQLSQRDGLTGVYNRHYFDQQAALYWQAFQQQHRPLSVLIMDIDHFKKYNDHYGHQAGDACLVAVAQVLNQTLQATLDESSGFFARYGGEEFVALVHLEQQQAKRLADALLQAVQHLQRPHAQSEMQIVTLSLGLASAENSQPLHFAQLLECADIALYQSKKQGRNRATLFEGKFE